MLGLVYVFFDAHDELAREGEEEVCEPLLGQGRNALEKGESRREESASELFAPFSYDTDDVCISADVC